MSSIQSLELGQNLEEFTFVKLLGAGGFGITYHAIDRSLQRDVAIKEYFPQQFAERRDDQTIVSRPGEDNSQTFQWGLDRFLAEARTLARIDHPNVVKVSRYFEKNGTAYLVMAFEQGSDLEDWLSQRSEPLSEQEILDLVLPLLDGLQAIHDKGLIHRDIKAQNIVIRGNGTPVLIDFGSARSVGREQTSLTTLISPGYSPPEQYSSDPAAQGPWTDIYAMAGVLYRMISGRGPQDALARITNNQLQPVAQVAPLKLSKNLTNAIDAGLALDVENRPKNIAEFRALLLGEKTPKQAPKPSEATTLLRSAPSATSTAAPKRIGLMASIGAAVIAVVVGLYFFVGTGTGSDSGSAFTSTKESAQAQVATTPSENPDRPQTAAQGQDSPTESNATPTSIDSARQQSPQQNLPSPAAVVPLYTLELALTPADTMVSIGDRPYTPNMQLAPGKYTLVAERQNYQSQSQEITISDNHFLQLSLEPSAFPFTIFAQPGNARIRINNIAAPYSPGMALPTGRYQVSVSAPGHQTWRGTIDHARAPTERDISLTRTHTLTLNINPQDAKVDINGKDYQRGMSLVAGEYTISASKPGFQSLTETVSLNQDLVTDIELKPSLGVLTLIVTPRDARITLPELGRTYAPGMRLPLGKVMVRVSRERYQTKEQNITIRPGNNAIAITLQRGG